MIKGKVFSKKVIGVLSLLVFFFSFGTPLLVRVSTVEADDNIIYVMPYTRYYTCPFGIAYTESGTDKESYYVDSYNPNSPHYTPTPNAPPAVGANPPNLGPPALMSHRSHPTEDWEFSLKTEYINLGWDHWRCR